jgi:hypothetical protein
MLEMINQDEDMKISFKCNAAHQLLMGLSLTNIAPNMIWVCLFIWLSFFEHHCLQFTDSSFNHLSLPHSWSEYYLFFPFQGPLYCPQLLKFSRSVEDFNVISIKDFADSIDVLLCLIIFLVLESTLIFQRSCLFKSSCWNEIKDVLFWKDLLKIKLFDQRPNTRYSKYTVLWLSCIL